MVILLTSRLAASLSGRLETSSHWTAFTLLRLFHIIRFASRASPRVACVSSAAPFPYSLSAHVLLLGSNQSRITSGTPNRTSSTANVSSWTPYDAVPVLRSPGTCSADPKLLCEAPENMLSISPGPFPSVVQPCSSSLKFPEIAADTSKTIPCSYATCNVETTLQCTHTIIRRSGLPARWPQLIDIQVLKPSILKDTFHGCRHRLRPKASLLLEIRRYHRFLKCLCTLQRMYILLSDHCPQFPSHSLRSRTILQISRKTCITTSRGAVLRKARRRLQETSNKCQRHQLEVCRIAMLFRPLRPMRIL